MGSSFKVIGGCTAGSLFEGLSNPVAGVVVGVIATVLVQSSSTTTSIVVSLVGADAMTVPIAIPIIMGANVGTSVTNTLVSFGQIDDMDAFERAFAGATVHDMFNFLSVAVILPIEVIFHPLELITDAWKPAEVEEGEAWEGPVKQWVAPLVKRVINANKDVIKLVAKGEATCADIYADDEITGLIKCSNVYNPFSGTESKVCPLFYKEGASQSDDMASGSVVLLLSIIGLCICLVGLVKVLSAMVLSSSQAAIKKATNVHPLIAMLVGCAVTILVQSSSITTSVLTPLVGLDIIKIEQMFPLTLGANIGTTFTALMASMVSSKPESVQIALCHLLFNVFGILIWYPIPWMRQWPMRGARQLGKMTRAFRLFPIVYIVFAFVVVPAILLGISELFAAGGAFVVIGVLLLLVVVGLFVKTMWFFYKQDGWTVVLKALEARQAKSDFYEQLPQTIRSYRSRMRGEIIAATQELER